MKKVILLITFLLLVSFVSASLNHDLNNCENSLRCIYMVAIKYGSFEACDILPASAITNCENFVLSQNPELESDLELRRAITKEIDSLGPVDFVNEQSSVKSYSFPIGVISVSLIFFVLFILFEKHRHESFLEDNEELANYIKHNQSLGKSDDEIKKALINTGWKIQDLEKVFKHLKK